MSDIRARYAARIADCMTLDDLARVLNDIEKSQRAREDAAYPGFCEKPNLFDYVDMTDLPTFAGTCPRDGEGIFSYSPTEQLVPGPGPHGEFWVVENRRDIEELRDELHGLEDDIDGVSRREEIAYELAEILGYQDPAEAHYHYPEVMT